MADCPLIEEAEESSRNVSPSMDNSQAIGSNSQDKTRDTSATLLALNNYRIPTEIVSQILSNLVPDGLRLSNDPACESDMTTVRALLNTSIRIKHEMLRHIFRHPLHIHISNGEICDCERMRKGEIPLLIQKVSHLPLHRWLSVTVCFAPTTQEVSCAVDHGSASYATFLEAPAAEHQGPSGWEFMKAVDCVIRQSHQIGDALRFHCQPQRRQWVYSGHRHRTIPSLTFDCYDPYIRDGTLDTNFIFRDPKRINNEFGNREIPIWEMTMIFHLVETWRWTSHGDPFQEIKLPPKIAVPVWNGSFQTLGSFQTEIAFPQGPERHTAQLAEDYSLWWQSKVAYPDRPRNLAHRLVMRHYQGMDWYLSMAPLIQNSTSRTIAGTSVLRLEVSELDSEAGRGRVEHWKGEFIASDE